MKVIHAQERFTKTRSGIVIGSAHIKRQELSADAERIQAAFLNHHRITTMRLAPLRRHVLATDNRLIARFARLWRWIKGVSL